MVYKIAASWRAFEFVGAFSPEESRSLLSLKQCLLFAQSSSLGFLLELGELHF